MDDEFDRYQTARQFLNSRGPDPFAPEPTSVTLAKLFISTVAVGTLAAAILAGGCGCTPKDAYPQKPEVRQYK